MPFIKEVTYGEDFVEIGNHLELSKKFMKDNSWKFKKITATRLCSALGLGGKFNTPFKLWCQMVNIFKEDMDEIVSKLGTTLEPKIREFVNKQLVEIYKIPFKYSFYKNSSVNYDCWKGINDVFGGIPDGEPYAELPPDNTQDVSKLMYDKGLPLLEIKTSSIDSFVYTKDELGQLKLKLLNGEPIVKEVGVKKNNWFTKEGKLKLPTEYKYQIALYMYLRNISKGILAVCFVDTKNYTHPENVDVNSSNTKAVEISFNPKDFENQLNKAREWYYKYIKTGISPEMTEEDKKWLQEQLKISAK